MQRKSRRPLSTQRIRSTLFYFFGLLLFCASSVACFRAHFFDVHREMIFFLLKGETTASTHWPQPLCRTSETAPMAAAVAG
ncbi:hypothetical protein [Pandoravirus japonicus]|uniref:Uncharacterized protein n=1 Tax=Pandoravirus japonicus TaxID=2823154 RepID=A0A811BQN6_9VIRU|nr:hypothetical protein [Pandoravirus japonicus]